MSRRFRIISWIVAFSDGLIGSVFLTSHKSLITPAFFYVFKFFPWQVWATCFLLTAVCMGAAIGSGNSKLVRKVGMISSFIMIIWGTEFALVLPSVFKGEKVSWLGVVLVSTIAAIKLVYLGMNASSWLDDVEDGISEYTFRQ